MGGVSAAVSKTAAAPIERIKLLVQNQVRSDNYLILSLPTGEANILGRCDPRVR